MTGTTGHSSSEQIADQLAGAATRCPAASDYVIGTSISSFSQVAIAYNGSPRSHVIEGPPLDPVHGRYQPSASDVLT